MRERERENERERERGGGEVEIIITFPTHFAVLYFIPFCTYYDGLLRQYNYCLVSSCGNRICECACI